MTRIHLTLFFCAFAAVAGCATSNSNNSSSDAIPKALRDRSDVRGGSEGEFKLPGDRVYVEINFFDKGQRLALVNAGSTRPIDVYSKYATPGVSLKVANNNLMADMYEALRRLEFDECVKSTSKENAAWSLMIDIDGQRKTAYYMRGKLTADRAQKLQAMQSVFLTGFNHTLQLQTVDPGKGGKAIFTNEEERLRKENAKASAKK